MIRSSPRGSSSAAWSISRPRELADHDLAGRGSLLEPRGDADGFTRDQPLSRIGWRGDDLARLEADPHLDPDPVLVKELLVERSDRSAGIQRRASGAQRVVLVRDGDSEGSHDGVTGVLLDGPSVSGEHRGDGLEVAPQHDAERLGVERLGERHRLDDIDEEDRDQPAELHRRFDGCSLGQKERLVLAEHRGLELLERRAWIEPELVAEHVAGRAIRSERVRLTARAVEREHELGARPLPQRLRRDEGLELGHELGVAAEREVGVHAPLDRGHAQLLEPGDVGLGERLVGEIRERRPAPEGKGLAQHSLGSRRIAIFERRAALIGEPGEAMEVDPLESTSSDVARGARDDRLRAQSLAELGDVDLNRVRGGFWRISRPEALDEPVDGDDATRLEREDGQQSTQLLAAERDSLSALACLQGAEEPQLELWHARPLRSVHIRLLVCCEQSFSRAFGTCPSRFDRV